MEAVEMIEQEHKKVKSGAGFPDYIKAIKRIGVTAFETWVIDGHTVYFGKDNFRTVSPPKYDKLMISHSVNKEKFVDYLKKHQQGKTDYFTFCTHCAETGIEKWIVNLEKMICTYFDQKNSEIFEEGIPQ